MISATKLNLARLCDGESNSVFLMQIATQILPNCYFPRWGNTAMSQEAKASLVAWINGMLLMLLFQQILTCCYSEYPAQCYC